MHSYLFGDSELKKKANSIKYCQKQKGREIDNLKQDDFEEVSLEVANFIIKMSMKKLFCLNCIVLLK